MSYCIYLRKSRTDMDAELRGEGETLLRHERTLLELCRKMNITPAAVYREIVSGETISARPIMQQLLCEVQESKWRGVIVMEIERLARGDTIDQGLVARAFRCSNTKIITPNKVYDPCDEFDEEYFEFSLFMSRREYKTIRRRMQAGRAAAVREGKYVGSVRPYGYERVRLTDNSGFTLAPVESEAEIVRCIFQWYLNDSGCSRIANRLNEMNVSSLRGGIFTASAVRDILKNPVYIGKLRWNRRKVVKTIKNGVSRPINADHLLFDGLHPAVIDLSTWYAVQKKFSLNPPRPTADTAVIQNPLAGLIRCNVCRRAMIRRPSGNGSASLLCPISGCTSIGSSLDIVEKLLLRTLGEWNRASHSPVFPSHQNKRKAPTQLGILKTELKKQTAQLYHLHDLLEQGIYSADIFQERSRLLQQRIAQTQTAIAQTQAHSEDDSALEALFQSIAPSARDVLCCCASFLSAAAKNQLLHTFIDAVFYEKSARNVLPTLVIIPKYR